MSRTKLFLDVVEDLQGLTDSLRALAQALATDEIPEPKPPKKVKPSPKKEVDSEPEVEETQEKVTPETSEPPTQAVTFEELRGAMATQSQKGKRAEVKALLTKYGAEKLSDIPVESYPEVMAEVEAL